jgi:hypothetical protein
MDACLYKNKLFSVQVYIDTYIYKKNFCFQYTYVYTPVQEKLVSVQVYIHTHTHICTGRSLFFAQIYINTHTHT